jgi:hypothetical protein
MLPAHVELDAKGVRQPEDGYDWSDTNRTTVRWVAGKMSRKNPHVIASDTEGKWEPEDGYDWVNPDRANDKSVRWVPGTRSSRYPNVVAAAIEGQWRPADGYAWMVNPHRPTDMRVVAISVPNQLVSPPMPPGFSPPQAAPTETPFDQGMADSAELEQWFASLSGDLRRGADWWAGRRSVPNPGTCSDPASGMNPQFIAGCEAAKARLAPNDLRRKADPEYRRGWNTYMGNAAPSPQPSVDQRQTGPLSPPYSADGDAASRLNQEELRRIQGR